jgi:hypothetical protein
MSPALTLHRQAPNTYEVRAGGDPVGVIRRDPGASTWSGFDVRGRRVVDHLPGSAATAAANVANHHRENGAVIVDDIQKLARRVAVAEEKAAALRVELELAAVEMRRQGSSLASIALAIGMSRPGVLKMLRRHEAAS